MEQTLDDLSSSDQPRISWSTSFGSDQQQGAKSSSVVRAFAHGAICRRIDPSWGGPIELFLVPASAPRLV